MRTDFDPVEARTGVAREVGAWVAQVALAPLSRIPSRHRTERDRHIRTLVFVHGLGGNRGNFFPLQSYLWLRGHRRQLSYNYATRGSIERCAVELKARIDQTIKGGRIDLVCHSLGGLVARTYLQMLGGDRRVDRLITLGTPHHGSEMSAWIPAPLVSQLSPTGPFLQHLNSLPAPDVTCLAFEAGRDLMVLPTRNAQSPFGHNVRHDHLGHLGLLLSPTVFRQIEEALAEPGVEAQARTAAEAG